MKIRLLFLLVGALLLVPVFGQFVPVIEWQKNYGGSTYDAVTSLAYTSDGGCVVAGSSNSADGDVTNGHGSYDYWIVKADGSGTIEWQRSLGGSSYDIANSIAQTSDGGYIVAGYTESTDGDVTNNYGGSDYWVVKLNGSGMIEWERSLGGSGGEIARSIAQTSDGGYVVAGSSNSPDGDVTGSIGGGDFWIVKLDAAGIIEWDRSLGGSAVDAAYSIVQTSDGGYVTAGYTVSTNGDVTTNHGSYDFWVVKLDANGILEWQRSLGGSSFERAQTIVQTTDGGYVVAGSTHSMDGDVTYNYGGDADFWVVKLDGTGTVQWQSTFGGSALETAREVIQSNDGGYIVSGSSYSADGLVTNNNGSSDLWILKLDGAGNLEWQRTLGGSGIEAAASIVLASDGSYIVAGTAQSSDGDGTNNFGGQDFWVVKLTNDFRVARRTVH